MFSNVVGGVLFLSYSHHVNFKVGLGPTPNNYVEFEAIRLLLKCVVDRNVKNRNIYTDSSLVIKWMNVSEQLQNVMLKPIGAICFQL